jgi:carboxyl-terminal processing protease
VKYSLITNSLLGNYHIFDYATLYNQQNPSIAPPASFKIDQQIFDDFRKYLTDNKFSYTSRCETDLKTLKESATREKFPTEVGDEINALQAKIEAVKNNNIVEFRDEVSALLKDEIVGRYYYQKGRIIAGLSDDPDVIKATAVLLDRNLLTSVLSGAATHRN